ncbi:helix-turn-helix domain-containing protein [Vibrio salinus]|uniref:helix-turn-helix domain-containing protein n=1 Tax=Vibrio salinus TaxID=2899784 RepID=UPI001E3D2A79|nr:XRE family transcriptional regulator [Vibrio salinus]MCE0495844.1 XRE family transcriptional regulator [Vibrio salinus]
MNNFNENGKKTAPIEIIASSLERERRKAGLSIAEVSRRAGIAKSTLSQLESGVGNPSLETLWSLCVVLDIPFARLIEPQKPDVQVLRKGEGVSVVSEQTDYIATLLATCPSAARRDIYLLVVQPGNPRMSSPHTTGVIEHIIISQGKALVGLADDPVELNPGDYISYPGDVPHIFQALEPDTVAVLVLEQS